MTENPYRHLDITVARQHVEAAKQTHADIVARVQADCTHEKVAEMDDPINGYGKRRICLTCGLEAESRWTFPTDHPLGTEFVATVSSDRFYGYRP